MTPLARFRLGGRLRLVCPGWPFLRRLAEDLADPHILLDLDLASGEASIEDLHSRGAGGRFALVLAGAPVLHQPDDEREDQPPDNDVAEDHEDPTAGLHVVMPEHLTSPPPARRPVSGGLLRVPRR